MKTSGIILAGGKSTRLGRNKALEPVLGKTLVQYVFDCLRPLVEQVFIVTSKDLAASPYPEGADVLIDIYPDKGPLSGIYTGLSSSGNDHCIAVGCDMPFLNIRLLRHMVEECWGYDAAVPRMSTSLIEPLHGVYSRSCLVRMKSQLEKGRLQVRELFKELKVKYINEPECRKFDPKLTSFININNQADLDKAIAFAGEVSSCGD